MCFQLNAITRTSRRKSWVQWRFASLLSAGSVKISFNHTELCCLRSVTCRKSVDFFSLENFSSNVTHSSIFGSTTRPTTFLWFGVILSWMAKFTYELFFTLFITVLFLSNGNAELLRNLFLVNLGFRTTLCAQTESYKFNTTQGEVSLSQSS